MKKKNRKGRFLMIAGLLLVAAALFLTAKNLLEERNAQQAAEARAAYEAKHGPLRLGSAGAGGSWDWICDPWPWDFCQEG